MAERPPEFGEGIPVLDLGMPSWYLALTGRIRGFWRREVLILLAAFAAGIIVGRML